MTFSTRVTPQQLVCTLMAGRLLLLPHVVVLLLGRVPHDRASVLKAGAVMVVGGARVARARARREATAKERKERGRTRKARARPKGHLPSSLPVRRHGIRPGKWTLRLANLCAGIGRTSARMVVALMAKIALMLTLTPMVGEPVPRE